MARPATRFSISTILNLSLGLAFLAVSLFVALETNRIISDMALHEAEQKARMMLDRNLAIHSYYSTILKPRLFELTAPFLPAHYFEPSWMSSSYAVREIQEIFRSLEGTDYYLKDAVVNARNPKNEADPIEAAFLAEANRDPGLVTKSSIENFGGVPTLVYLRRGEVLDESCLRCHGDPSRAPSDLVKLYGDSRGFHRDGELGQVISAISIRVPLAQALASAAGYTRQLTGILLAIFAAFFLLQGQLYRRLLYKPIAAIRDKATQIASDEGRLGEAVPVPTGRELGELGLAFNRMSLALRDDRDLLERRIAERSADLAAANDRLERDVEERKRTEALLTTALEENQRLLRELQHRAKNSFMMISSLIGLTAGSHAAPETREVLDELDMRVRSISELYSFLYSSGSAAEVRLDDYCSRVVLAMSGLAGSVAMATDFSPVVVPVKTAAPIGLILAELLTNALKHAFSGGTGGRVAVRLRGEEGGARLEVEDDGVGLGSARKGGTGMTLVEALANQIGGEFSATSSEKGTLCLLRFRL